MGRDRAPLRLVRIGALATLALAPGTACLRTTQFTCATDTDCAGGAAPGVCEDSRYCSFPDPECSGGRRYGGLSGPLADRCVGDVGLDGGVDGPRDDGGPTADARVCFGAGAYEVCLDAAPSGDVSLVGALDTSTDTRCSPLPAAWGAAGQPAACMIAAASIDVPSMLQVTGSRALVLIAERVTIGGTLDVASHRAAAPGPAANAASCGAFAQTPANQATGAGGGAGGSFLTAGGSGGRGDNNAAAGLPSGPLGASPVVLRGGCAGQTGGTGSAAAGAPGAGGGALYIAASELAFGMTGTINASGAGGTGGGMTSGGSGGGSGGMIVLWSTSGATTGARLLANGGGGASGGTAVSGTSGNDPMPTSPLAPAAGGFGGGGAGGSGFAGGTPANPGSQANNRGGGGGGGGAGFVQSNRALGGATVSPAVVVVP